MANLKDTHINGELNVSGEGTVNNSPMLNLAFMKKYFGNTVPPHTVLYSGNAGNGDLTLKANWQQFDMLFVQMAWDQGTNLTSALYPVWWLKQGIATQNSRGNEGIVICPGNAYWAIKKSSTTTNWIVQDENSIIREIWGIKFE